MPTVLLVGRLHRTLAPAARDMFSRLRAPLLLKYPLPPIRIQQHLRRSSSLSIRRPRKAARNLSPSACNRQSKRAAPATSSRRTTSLASVVSASRHAPFVFWWDAVSKVTNSRRPNVRTVQAEPSFSRIAFHRHVQGKACTLARGDVFIPRRERASPQEREVGDANSFYRDGVQQWRCKRCGVMCVCRLQVGSHLLSLQASRQVP